jgi:acyl dehydratase
MPAPKVLALRDLAEGFRASVEFSVTSEQMRQFAELSGDFNPLHVDDAFARSRGFDGRVVYGALFAAKVSHLIGMELPGRDSVWASLTLDFRKPLYVDQVAQVEGTLASVSESTGLIQLNLTVRRGPKVLARGKAEVVLGR